VEKEKKNYLNKKSLNIKKIKNFLNNTILLTLFSTRLSKSYKEEIPSSFSEVAKK
jgi:hypothetical protein